MSENDMLREVRKEQMRTRLRLGYTGWFELLLFGAALVVASVATLAVESDRSRVLVFGACLVPYYVAVYVRRRRQRERFGVRGESAPVANAVSTACAVGGLVAVALLDGDAAILTVFGLAAVACMVPAVMYRSWVLVGLAVVDVLAGIASAVTTDGGYLPAMLVVGAGYALVGLALLIQLRGGDAAA